jgi:hypothetical protein
MVDRATGQRMLAVMALCGLLAMVLMAFGYF